MKKYVFIILSLLLFACKSNRIFYNEGHAYKKHTIKDKGVMYIHDTTLCKNHNHIKN